MSRSTSTTAAPTDSLSRVLASVADPASRQWLEALLTRGAAAAVSVGGRRAQQDGQQRARAPLLPRR